jgi:predicted RND superfamily exporter protein
LLDRVKDNIAYVLGLPAAISGAFGFIWQSSGEEAALNYKVEQLEQAVAEIKAENDLLGGGAKNFSIDMSGAPGGSVTVIVVAAVLVLVIALLFWYQSKRKKR